MKTELLATTLCLLLTGAAIAGSADQAPRSVPAAESRHSERELAEAPSTTQDVERDCPRPTGTRIVRKDRDGCVIGAGRTYHRRELDSTGARDAAHALEMLDPSIRGRR
jgi:hypothetical protein